MIGSRKTKAWGMGLVALVATGGCNATVSILALLPLYEAGVVDRTSTVLDLKVGSSEGGAIANEGAHHPVRSGVVRPYKATGHRHVAEVEAALGRSGSAQVRWPPRRPD